MTFFPFCRLQVMTGRSPSDETIGDDELTRWVSSHWVDNMAMKVIDPRMRLEESIVTEVRGALKLGLMCTSRKMRDRPSMADAVHLLENLSMFAGINCFNLEISEDEKLDKADMFSIGSSSQETSFANESMLNVVMELRE